jgi:hypothetical protein
MKKRSSVDSNMVSQKKLDASKKHQSSIFSLYGMTTQNSQSPNWKKMANIRSMNPGDAANKFYDKNIIRALDKFTSQEKHLKNLVNYKNEVKRFKKGAPSQTFLLQDGSTTSIRFNVDERTEVKKLKYHYNHLNSRNFNFNEKMMNIYQNNMNLQNKLDEIQLRSGPYHQIKLKTASYNKTPQGIKGSLNYNYKKKEAIRID